MFQQDGSTETSVKTLLFKSRPKNLNTEVLGCIPQMKANLLEDIRLHNKKENDFELSIEDTIQRRCMMISKTSF